MPEHRPFWLTLTLCSTVLATLSACADAEPPDEHVYPEPAVVSPADLALQLGDGSEITAESLQCIYRQSTGSADDLSLQLQFLSDPGHVAFAAYIDNPAPATPFTVEPRDVDRFSFEAFQDSAGYYADLGQGEVAVHLDALPSPSSLSVGQAVRLRGRLEITAFAMDGSSFRGGAAVAPLDLAQGSVPIDCEAVYQESLVFD